MQLLPLLTMGMPVPGSGGGGGGGPTPTEVSIELGVVNGQLVVDPDPAQVRKDGTITWHTKEGDHTPFEIVPKIGWHAEHGEPPADVLMNVLGLPSKPNEPGTWQQVVARAGKFPGRFPYGVIINGVSYDPDVVIKPQ